MVPPRRPATRSQAGSSGQSERGRPRGSTARRAAPARPRVEDPAVPAVDPVELPPGTMEARMANLERMVMTLVENRQAPPAVPEVVPPPPAAPVAPVAAAPVPEAPPVVVPRPEAPVVAAPPAEKTKKVEVGQFIKNGGKPFNGTETPMQADAWIKEVEKICAVMECTDSDKVRFAIFMLRMDAEEWWLSQTRLLAEGNREVTWTVFTEAFFEQYFTALYRKEQEKEFLNLRQGGMTVREYERKFNQLSRFGARFIADEVDRATRFQDGLNLTIRQFLAAVELQDYASVVKRAEKLEKEQDIRKKVRERKLGANSQGVQKKKNNFGKKSTGGESSGKNDNKALEKGNNNFGDKQKKPITCYRCGKQGHISTQCDALVLDRATGMVPVQASGPAIAAKPISSYPPAADKGKEKVGGRVFAMTTKQAEASTSTVAGSIIG